MPEIGVRSLGRRRMQLPFPLGHVSLLTGRIGRSAWLVLSCFDGQRSRRPQLASVYVLVQIVMQEDDGMAAPDKSDSAPTGTAAFCTAFEMSTAHNACHVRLLPVQVTATGCAGADRQPGANNNGAVGQGTMSGSNKHERRSCAVRTSQRGPLDRGTHASVHIHRASKRQR